MQLYTSFYNVYCDMAVSSGYIEDTEVIDREVTSQTSFESKYLSTSSAVMESIIEKASNYEEQFDSNYSYGEVTIRISEKIVGLYVEPGQTNVEKENEIREETSNAIDQETIGSTTVTEVTPEEVPEDVKEPEQVVVVDDEDNVVTEGYIEGLAAGRTDGSNAAWNQQTSTGTIPNTISASGAPTPGGDKGSEYINGYKEGYAEGWNNYVASAKAAQSTPTTEYESVENGNEEIISETNPTDVQYEEDTNFVPIEDGEEVEIIISKLNDMKNYVLSVYGETYDLALNEEGVKKM